MKDFPCTSCGLCCKQIGLILTNKTQLPEFQQFLLSKFPYKALEDGSCEMLDSDNQCSVYNDRPLLCNAKLLSISMHIPYEVIAQNCNDLIDKYGLDESFKVDLLTHNEHQKCT